MSLIQYILLSRGFFEKSSAFLSFYIKNLKNMKKTFDLTIMDRFILYIGTLNIGGFSS